MLYIIYIIYIIYIYIIYYIIYILYILYILYIFILYIIYILYILYIIYTYMYRIYICMYIYIMSLFCNILDACSFSGKPHLQRRPSKRLLGSVACLQRWWDTKKLRASVEHWKSGGEVGKDGKFQARKYRGLKSWEYNIGCNGMYNQGYDMVSLFFP